MSYRQTVDATAPFWMINASQRTMLPKDAIEMRKFGQRSFAVLKVNSMVFFTGVSFCNLHYNKIQRGCEAI